MVQELGNRIKLYGCNLDKKVRRARLTKDKIKPTILSFFPHFIFSFQHDVLSLHLNMTKLKTKITIQYNETYLKITLYHCFLVVHMH